MWTPETEINDAIKSSEDLAKHVILSNERKTCVENSLKSKYGRKSSATLRESILSNSTSYRTNDCLENLKWLPIKNLLMFPEEGKKMYEVPDFIKIIKIYNACASFDFYVTDKFLSFMICFTSEQRLLMLGAAEDWAKKVKL